MFYFLKTVVKSLLPHIRDPTRETSDSLPNPELPAWPRYSVPELQYLELNLTLTTQRAVLASAMAFWNRYIPQVRDVIGKR